MSVQLGMELLREASIPSRDDLQTPDDARSWDPSGMLSTPQQDPLQEHTAVPGNADEAAVEGS